MKSIDTLPLYILTKKEAETVESLLAIMSDILSNVIANRGIVLGDNAASVQANALNAIADAIAAEYLDTNF